MLRIVVLLAASVSLGIWTCPSHGEEGAPKFEFIAAAAFRGEKVVSPNGPADKFVFKPDGRWGQVIDVATDKPVGAKLDAGAMWTDAYPRLFSCWTFSADGKYLVTGSSFIEVSAGHGGERTDTGRIQVWEVASGKQVVQFAGRIGSILQVAFSADGKKIVYNAARYEIDGP